MIKNEKIGWNLQQSYLNLPSFFYTEMNPTAVHDPKIVAFNKELALELGLHADDLEGSQGEAIFSGNTIPEGSAPLAQAYAGHQFENFTNLGDGRAVLLGEQVTPGDQRFDIQLKGAGKTAYSRGGDGRAALGPMLREYLISEAMHALGIPTTRGLAVVTTGEPVIREEALQGAILTRVASSHIRVGTFQYATVWGTEADLRALADYTIERYNVEYGEKENKYVALLKYVIDQQAQLIAKWQLVGFVHGVMNTDNMAISGETIDYGPCAFIDTYDRSRVFSSIDQQDRRYAYGNQPYIGGWNLTRFAETLLPLIHEEEEQAIQTAQEELSSYQTIFEMYFETGMRAKLGLFHKEETDDQLINELLELMVKYKLDMTNTFVSLTFDTIENIGCADKADFTSWYARWQKRRTQQEKTEAESEQLMKKSNPAVIPRNHHVEEALQAAEDNNYRLFDQLLHVLSTPYAHTPEQAAYANVPSSNRAYKTFCGT